MCRILSISGKIEYKKTTEIIQKFQRLAEYGKVPKGAGKGHKDGWGILAYEKNKPELFVRNYRNAIRDPIYLKTVEGLKESGVDIVISHLRKASVGVKNINNAHPFVYENYSFCQNGTIFGNEKIPLKVKFKNLVRGETDSEKLFVYILQFLSEHKKSDALSIRNAIKKAIINVRENFDFTASNMIFSDGKYIWALREVNEKNKYVIKKKMADYYSLFIGVGKKYNIICSERLLLKDVKWKTMQNHELVEIDVKNNKVKNFKI
jgi:predicted glutamine amidotransferase